MNRFWSKSVCYKSCDEGFYLNELACKCLSDVQCFAPCPKDQFDMPTENCGCTEDYDEYLALFPAWATEEDIKDSIVKGKENNKPDPKPVWPEPPIYTIPEGWKKCKVVEDCADYGTFNYLSCKCFSNIQCMMWCGEEMKMDPVNGCTCITNEEYRAYFPEKAS